MYNRAITMASQETLPNGKMEIKLRDKPLSQEAQPKRVPVQTRHGIDWVYPPGYKPPEPSAEEIRSLYAEQGYVEGTIALHLEEWLKYKNNLESFGSDIMDFLRNFGLEIPRERPVGLESIVMQFGKNTGPEVLPDSVLLDQKSDLLAEIHGRITYGSVDACEILIKMTADISNAPTKEQCGPHKHYFENKDGPTGWQIALSGMYGQFRVGDLKRVAPKAYDC